MVVGGNIEAGILQVDGAITAHEIPGTAVVDYK